MAYEQKPVGRNKPKAGMAEVRLDVTGNGAQDLQLVSLYRGLGYEIKPGSDDKYSVTMQAPIEMAEKHHNEAMAMHRRRLGTNEAPEGVNVVANQNEVLVGKSASDFLGSDNEL